jgi:hypothetical protein
MGEFGYFDDAVKRSYFDEMEARYRAESRLPARGDGWVNETHLARVVAEALPGVEIIREARLDWLNGQRLDIFVPSLHLAIEYQGIQHYEPIDLFGGLEALAKRQVMDARKRDACLAAAVRLIEWRYDEPIDIDRVRIRLELSGQQGGRLLQFDAPLLASNDDSGSGRPVDRRRRRAGVSVGRGRR